MDSITCRRATQNDLQILIDYRIEFLIEYGGRQSSEPINELNDSLTHYFGRALQDSTYVCYIAHAAGAVAGIGGMTIRTQPGSFKNPSGRVGYLMNMYTIPLFRRKGICTAILDLLIADGRQMGITAFELHATREGEFVYTQNGFEIHSEPTYRKYIAQ